MSFFHTIYYNVSRSGFDSKGINFIFHTIHYSEIKYIKEVTICYNSEIMALHVTGYFVQEFIDDPENEKNNLHSGLFCFAELFKFNCSIRLSICYVKPVYHCRTE